MKQDQFGARRYGHLHAEAYCLMTYRSDDGTVEERIWNSRDGVTPFVILSRDKKKELTHVDWRNDRYAPHHVPQPGDLIFVDLTMEMARQYAHAHVEAWWDHPQYPMRQMFETKQDALDEFAKSYYGDGHAPTVIEVKAPENRLVML